MKLVDEKIYFKLYGGIELKYSQINEYFKDKTNNLLLKNTMYNVNHNCEDTMNKIRIQLEDEYRK